MPPDEAAPDAAALLAALPCGVGVFADDGRVLATNAALRDLLGYGDGELEGGAVDRLLTVAGRIFYQTHLFPLVRHAGRARELFLLLRRRAGGDVGALVNAARVAHGGAEATCCAFFEVRERRRFEDELLRARRAAEEANAALTARGHELEQANERLQQQAVELELQQAHLQEQAAELEQQQEALQLAHDALQARTGELERARAEADGANRAKSDFLATMSHELRTPLNAIGGYVELLELGIHGPLTEPQRESLGRIARSQRHLLRLINEVLNLSRIEAGRVDYDIADVPVGPLVAAVTPMVEPQMGAAGLTFRAAVPPDLAVRADRDKAQQVLINLLTNALKFTPPGGRVAVTAHGDAAGRVAVRVADSGIGIPAEKLDSIFEPFVQVDVGRTRRVEGTGLGLAISRDLARGMGGDLTVESTLGAGSTFTLTLPRA
jgi:signal transduction histidine kinase